MHALSCVNAKHLLAACFALTHDHWWLSLAQRVWLGMRTHHHVLLPAGMSRDALLRKILHSCLRVPIRNVLSNVTVRERVIWPSVWPKQKVWFRNPLATVLQIFTSCPWEPPTKLCVPRTIKEPLWFLRHGPYPCGCMRPAILKKTHAVHSIITICSVLQFHSGIGVCCKRNNSMPSTYHDHTEKCSKGFSDTALLLIICSAQPVLTTPISYSKHVCHSHWRGLNTAPLGYLEEQANA